MGIDQGFMWVGSCSYRDRSEFFIIFPGRTDFGSFFKFQLWFKKKNKKNQLFKSDRKMLSGVKQIKSPYSVYSICIYRYIHDYHLLNAIFLPISTNFPNVCTFSSFLSLSWNPTTFFSPTHFHQPPLPLPKVQNSNHNAPKPTRRHLGLIRPHNHHPLVFWCQNFPERLFSNSSPILSHSQKYSSRQTSPHHSPKSIF